MEIWIKFSNSNSRKFWTSKISKSNYKVYKYFRLRYNYTLYPVLRKIKRKGKWYFLKTIGIPKYNILQITYTHILTKNLSNILNKIYLICKLINTSILRIQRIQKGKRKKKNGMTFRKRHWKMFQKYWNSRNYPKIEQKRTITLKIYMRRGKALKLLKYTLFALKIALQSKNRHDNKPLKAPAWIKTKCTSPKKAYFIC